MGGGGVGLRHNRWLGRSGGYEPAGAWKAVRAAIGSYRGARGGRPGSGTAMGLVDTQLDMHPTLLSFST